MEIVLGEQYFDRAYDQVDEFVVLRRGEILMQGTKDSLSQEKVLEGVSV